MPCGIKFIAEYSCILTLVSVPVQCGLVSL